jgi:hypothetical protein
MSVENSNDTIGNRTRHLPSGNGMHRNCRFFCTIDYNKIHRTVKLLHALILYADHHPTCKLWDLIIQQSKRKAIPVTSLEKPWKFQKDKAPRFQGNRHMKVVRLWTLRTDSLYPQEIFLVLISATGWVDPRALVWPEGLCQWKFPITPSGNQTRDFWLVQQCVNQLRHRSVQHNMHFLPWANRFYTSLIMNLYSIKTCSCLKIRCIIKDILTLNFIQC